MKTLSRLFLALALGLASTTSLRAATFTVSNTGDTGAGSLRAAIASANAVAGSTVVFDSSFSTTKTIALTSGQIAISADMTITGPGARLLTISGSNNSRIFLINEADVNANKNVTITDMTLTLGNGSGEIILGAGINFFQGGAIYSTENLTLRRCTISGNSSAGPTGGLQMNGGTAVSTNIIDSCTISGNQITNGSSNSGGIGVVQATVTATNSTFSGNTGFGSGGAGTVGGGGTLNMINCTVVGNTVAGTNGGGGFRTLNATGALNLKNTIVAGNTCAALPSGNDLLNSAGSITGNNNVIGDAGSSGGLTNGTSGNIVGVSGAGIRTLSTIINTTLANNGGPTDTHALAAGSVALDVGSNADAVSLTSDQRGFTPRVVNTTVDIGSYETGAVNPAAAPATVLTNLAQTTAGQAVVGPTQDFVTARASQQFTTGASNLQLNTVTLNFDPSVGITGASQPLSLAIYSNETNAAAVINPTGAATPSTPNTPQPGTQIGSTLVATTSARPTTAGDYVYTATGGLLLAANTKYWIVISSTEATGKYNWNFTNSNTFTTAGGWSVDTAGNDSGSYNTSGASYPNNIWLIYGPGNPNKFSIDATAVAAPPSPTVTMTTTATLATATTVTITGTNFDAATPGNNTVVFSPAGTGTVTAATATQLTVTSVTGLRGGPLSAVVTNGAGNSGAAVQVASVAPVITMNPGTITSVANQLTINGVGFDPVAFGNNSVVFSPAGTGNVAGSTAGSLNVTGISGLTAGALNAVVTTNGVASASVQVATVVAAPNLTINDVTLSEGNAGTTSFTFTVSLSAPAPTGGVTFDIATQDNTATTGDSDYVFKSLTSQTITSGNSIYTFTVLVNGDTKYEPNESFFVNVTNVTNAVLSDGVGMGNIINDDPLPNVSINTTSLVTEGNAGTTTLNFTLSLTGASSQTITVLASTFDGTATTADSDYVANSQIITFAPGVTSMPFNVTVNGDTKPEGDETLFVKLTLPVNAGLGVTVGQGTITNDDAGAGNLYVVTTNSDATWTTLNLANGKVDGTNTVTLRSAVIAANQSGAGPHTISVPASVGTITLSQTNPATPATTATNGGKDIVVGSNFSTIIIQGVGGNAVIVGPGGFSDVITTGLKSDGFTACIVNLSLDHLDISGGTLTGVFVGGDDGNGNANSVSRTQITNCNIHNNSNSDPSFGQGGAIQAGVGYLTVSDTIFANNSATNSGTGQGGAIFYSLPNSSGQGSVGALSISDCTFTNNTAGISGGVGGGAIYANVISSGGANTAIKRSVFTGNSTSAGADGGAVVLDGVRTTDVSYNNFSTNSVSTTGHGGAIAVNTGVANINFNRFDSNSAATAANGKTVYRSLGALGTVNVNLNWWTRNSGPAVNDLVGSFTSGNNLNLKLTATPNSVALLGTSALQADFFTSSSATAVTLTQVYTLLGRTAAYGSPVLGTITDADTSLKSDGKALATFNAGAVAGAGSASVTIDGQTVTANISVGATSNNATLASLTASAGALSPAFVPATISYTVSTPGATATTTITPTATNPASTLSYNVNGAGFTAITTGATSAPISLNPVGVNTPIQVKVVSADTTVTTFYTLNVTRQAGIGAPVTVFTAGVDAPPGAPGTTFSSIRSGMTIASSGALAFRGFLTIGTGGVDANNYMGMWKSPDGSSAAVALVARSGSVAPDTGSGLFDILPVNAVINNAAQTSFLGFARVNTGAPLTTASTDSGVWSELSGSGLHLLLREGTAITGGTVTAAAPSTWVATGATKAAFTVQFASGSALVRGGFTGATPSITTLATEGGAAPAIGGGTSGTFDTFVGNSADPRMDATDDVAFLGYLQTSGTPGIWYQAAAGSLVAVAKGGQTSFGIADTFTAFERPSLGSATSVAFRAFLTTNGQSVFRGNPATPSTILPVAVTGYTNTQIPTIPAGRKLWSIWSPFSASSGRIAFRASMVDTAGNTNENRAILADTSGTMTVVAKVGDAATGIGGETFANFDHPVIGDGNQAAFVASTNTGSVGVWREAAGGGALLLVVKVGDVITISGTPETVATITIPGTSTDDRKYETKTMDSAGHLLIHVTYASGKTGIILSAP